jgi:hypothetical protein
MKIALCFSGFIRDLNETKNFWTELIKEYDMDVYASFWDLENETNGDTKNEFLKTYTPKKIEFENYDTFKNSTLDILKLNVESPSILSEQFRNSAEEFGVLSMYYKIWKANLLTKDLGIDYDVVIRARTDIVLDNMFKIEKNNFLNVPMGVNMTPIFPNSDGINDCFAYANPKIMDYYSVCFFHIMEYLNDGHYLFPPEHLLAVHFSKIRIQVNFFENYMMITRVWKGGDNEIYNKFINQPKQIILWSDVKEYIPESIGNFKKDSIKDDFIV